MIKMSKNEKWFRRKAELEEQHPIVTAAGLLADKHANASIEPDVPNQVKTKIAKSAMTT